MDLQARGGSTGSAGVASWSDANVDRRERLKRLAMEVIDLASDPYIFKNHLGSYECRLCLTIHNNEGSYLAHTQGKKHSESLARRAAKEAAEKSGLAYMPTVSKAKASTGPRKVVVKIGRPGYKIMKLRDPETSNLGLLIQIHYPEFSPTSKPAKPLFRFMSAFEQKVEVPDRHYQYLVIAAEPYESISFKIPSREIDTTPAKFIQYWDTEAKMFTLQFFFLADKSSGR